MNKRNGGCILLGMLVVLGLSLCIQGFGKTAGEKINIDLAENSKYLLSIYGAKQDEGLGKVMALGDLNGDGLDDLAISAPFVNNNGKKKSGSVYVIYGKHLTVTGKVLDLSLPESYNIRYDGVAEGSVLGRTLMFINLPRIGPSMIMCGSGKIYVIGGPLPPGTGNVVDLSRSDNFNILFDGSNGVFAIQIDRKGGDPLMCFGGRNMQDKSTWYGSIIIRQRSLPKEKGSIINLNDPGEYELRYDSDRLADIRAIFTEQFNGDFFGNGVAAIGDFNGDGIQDIAASASEYSSHGLKRNGAIYLFYGPFTGPAGRVKSLADPSNFNCRFDGSISRDNVMLLLPDTLGLKDINGDGRDDLLIGRPTHPNGEKKICGVLQIIYGTGENRVGYIQDLADDRYNVRIKGILGEEFGTSFVADHLTGGKGPVLIAGAKMGWRTVPHTPAGAVYIFRGPWPDPADGLLDVTAEDFFDTRIMGAYGAGFNGKQGEYIGSAVAAGKFGDTPVVVVSSVQANNIYSNNKEGCGVVYVVPQSVLSGHDDHE